MKLVWVLCFCLVGKLHAAAPGEGRAAAESSLGSRYMMAFPMNDEEQLAEESAEAAVKTLAEAIVGGSESDDDDDDDQDDTKATEEQAKEPVIILGVEEKKDNEGDKDGEATIETVEPMGILEAQLEAEDGTQKPPRRSLFKRPKIEELRKILGFPSADANAQKAKTIPPEKPKAFQNMFKPKQKMDSSPNGLQISLPLRREDRRPFGFPMLPLPRNEGIIRPFGFPDLVQAASSIIRRAIIDDIDAQDINKDDKDDDEEDETNEEQENNEETTDDDDDDDEPLVIVPIPDGKDDLPRPPLFRRFPIPLPFPVPRPMPVSRPRFPMPPLTPVAFFLPLAQQIMHNIITRPVPRSQPPPLLPVTPVHQIFPFHPPTQNIIPFVPVQHSIVPMQQPFVHVQQPFHHMMPVHTQMVPQQAVHAPILIPLASNPPRPLARPMARRMPMPQPHPAMGRRMPMQNPMVRMPMTHQPHPMQHGGAQMINHMPRRPMPEPTNRPLPRMVRPPLPPVHPVLLMMSPIPTNFPMMPQQQQHVPVFHRPQHLPLMQQQQVPVFPRHMPVQLQVPQEEERIIFVRSDPEEQDDDQEVLLLVPTDEVEIAQRPPVLLPQQVMRPMPSPVASPLQRIRLLKELLMARQANRQQAQMQAMASQGRMPRIVEIVQQQLRIIPAHHQRGQQPMPAHPSRADASELHPVYVPYPGPQ